MSKEDTKELLKFLKPFPVEVRELALWLRAFVWDHYPDANELIYDNYNALALGWSPTDKLGHTFCSIAVFGKYVHFGFYWGSEIADPEKMLLGKGHQYRYVIVHEKKEFPKAYITLLLKEAYAHSLGKVISAAKNKSTATSGGIPKKLKSLTIVKSISPVKKRPGLVQLKKK